MHASYYKRSVRTYTRPVERIAGAASDLTDIFITASLFCRRQPPTAAAAAVGERAGDRYTPNAPLADRVLLPRNILSFFRECEAEAAPANTAAIW